MTRCSLRHCSYPSWAHLHRDSCLKNKPSSTGSERCCEGTINNRSRASVLFTFTDARLSFLPVSDAWGVPLYHYWKPRTFENPVSAPQTAGSWMCKSLLAIPARGERATGEGGPVKRQLFLRASSSPIPVPGSPAPAGLRAERRWGEEAAAPFAQRAPRGLRAAPGWGRAGRAALRRAAGSTCRPSRHSGGQRRPGRARCPLSSVPGAVWVLGTPPGCPGALQPARSRPLLTEHAGWQALLTRPARRRTRQINPGQHFGSEPGTEEVYLGCVWLR